MESEGTIVVTRGWSWWGTEGEAGKGVQTQFLDELNQV